MYYAYTFKLSGSGSDYSIVNTLGDSYIYDTQDGTNDGYIATGDPLEFKFFGSTKIGTLSGTTDNGIVIVSASGTFLLSNTLYVKDDPLDEFDDIGSIPFCFLEGTTIATPQGEVAIESLKTGDIVLTQDGREVAVKWMGYQRVQNRIGTSTSEAPVRVAAGSIAPNVPHTDLYVTGSHAVMIDDLLINASVLCNGGSIEYISLKDMPSEFTYYHIETEAHEAVVANGLAAETFLDAPDRRNFDNYTQYVDTYGADREITEMSNTRITAVKNLPQAIKDALNITEVETDWADILKNGATITLKQAS